ncbi:endonuclease/exonuclease/phosphatase family domain-containing protein 1-like [Sitophilus oryzae]|uniref:Endonuclease/exonuclease/phosphatase family domain-containing protein 1 n=1 Tax=Sitophilus oryzae TaxID=7048 RepID=A0A6J2Y4N6_SITOR|nr:endonuclease/exonuclease/phosphatase family domain-containing protein 1-like [Sitophilus oryzae]XP_030757965.1 endonuclease/exonuclease/phosphatase family domain-containing protein 1-like [Sitophilus oryzae]
MGQNASLPKGRRKSLRSFVRKSISKRNLSHTFTVPGNNDFIELLNINLATEEDLMTLPGINREIAKNIVNHRKAIGRYRRVEDLALVKGVGADKFEKIRFEVCVTTRRNFSCSSSRAHSYDSLKSTDSRMTSKSNKLINVNKASVFDLQSIPGITQEIAASIIIYRNKKGSFSKMEDLLKVKHINRILLDNISRYFTLHDEDGLNDSSISNSSIITNGITNIYPVNGYTFKSPLKNQIPNGLTPSSAIDIFELLSTYSPRPVTKEIFKFCRDGEPAIRICSWNLHELSVQKALNLGVREVICRTILENGISLLALQDIRDAAALKIICDELNKPSLRRVEEWKESSLNWNFCMIDAQDSTLGFLYDSGGVMDVELISLMEGPVETKPSCEALIANFGIGDLNLQVVNISLNRKVDIKHLHEKIIDLTNEEQLVLLCMDFSNCFNIDDDHLTIGNLKPVFPLSTNNNFPVLNDENFQVSNMLTNSTLSENLTGYKDVIIKGLTHLAIPNGWSWGGPASPYCPIWIELTLYNKRNCIAL